MITAELRQAIAAAAGLDADPRLRPGPVPGSYASSLPFRLPPAAAQDLASRLAAESITVNAIAPGPFDSKMMAYVLDDPESRAAVAASVSAPSVACRAALAQRSENAWMPSAWSSGSAARPIGT